MVLLVSLVTDILMFGGFALGIYASSQLGRFLPLSALSTPFLSASLTCWFLGRMELGFLLAAVTALGSSVVCGTFSAYSSHLLHKVAHMDRLTSGLVTYFVLLALGMYFASSGIAIRPALLSHPNPEAQLAVFFFLVTSGVILLTCYERSFSGLKSRAFSARPHFASRFGFKSSGIYLPALVIGEILVALTGNAVVLVDGSMDSNFCFLPALTGIAAASFVGSFGRRFSEFLMVLWVLALVALWRVGWWLAAYVEPEFDIKWNIKHASMGLLVAGTGLILAHIRAKLDGGRVGDDNQNY